MDRLAQSRSDRSDRLLQVAAFLSRTLIPYLAVLVVCLAHISSSDPREYVPFLMLLRTIGVVLVLVLSVHIVFRWCFRSPLRELILSNTILSFGLYRLVQVLCSEYVNARVFLFAWMVLNALLCVSIALWLRKSLLHSVCKLYFCVFVALVTIQITRMVQYTVPDLLRLNKVASLGTNTPVHNGQRKRKAGPDIYYIVLDAYGREDVLDHLYHYDNSRFLDELHKRGFFICRQSRSNYHLTELSVASSLNMSHLKPMELDQFSTRMPIHRLIQHNALTTFLKREGYATIAFETGKSTTECTSFDKYISFTSTLNEYQDLLLHSTPAGDLYEWFAPPGVWSPARSHRQRTLKTLAMLPEAARRESSPAFVFAHIMCPHPPFVFGEEGEEVDVHGVYLLADGKTFQRRWSREVYTQGYRRQITYLNSQILKLCDQIQSNKSRPAVIILQGDHGPRSQLASSVTDQTFLQEGFGILNAIWTPQTDPPSFYESMSPVNTFRVILNDCFGADFDLLEDRSYIEVSPYEFVDVTHLASQTHWRTDNLP